MPDWSYHTLFRPVLFRLPFETARDLCFRSMGLLARLPGGGLVIDLFGHMRPDRRLAKGVAGIGLDSCVGLAAGLDAKADAVGAMSRFGFGLMEVGPVTIDPDGRNAASLRVTLTATTQRLQFSGGVASISADGLARQLTRSRPRVPILLRLEVGIGDLGDDSRTRLVDVLKPLDGLIVGITLSSRQCDSPFVADHVRDWLQLIRETGFAGPVFYRSRDEVDPCEIEAAGLAGVLFDGSQVDEVGLTMLGSECRSGLESLVRSFRGSLHSDLTVLTAGGIVEPVDAVSLVDAGADCVLIDSGLVFAGPGLPKRCNETLVATQEANAAGRFSTRSPLHSSSPRRATQQSWFWSLLLAIAMLGGGLLAMVIATTRVLLPYDEAQVGVTIEELCGVNDKLLSFLTHDRVTLAGTMLADGILYLALSLWGMRAGYHWARVALLTSALVGFFGFFLFLGFGYFDPFHAFVTAVMFQFTLLAMYASTDSSPQTLVPDLHNDRAWRLHQWGQLLVVIHGGAIIIAGLVISFVGVTSVFVQEDLEFMGTTAETLLAFNRQLVPMIAHDRASFGAMLVSCGIAVLLSSLWGFHRGAAWLWWAILLAGTIAYGSTIGVHLAVGYTSLKHLLPAYAGMMALGLSSALTGPYLVGQGRC